MLHKSLGLEARPAELYDVSCIVQTNKCEFKAVLLLLLCSFSQLDLSGSVPMAGVPMARLPYWRASASALPSPSPWLAQYQLLLAQQAYYRPQPGLESRTSLAHLVGGDTSHGAKLDKFH